MRKFLPVLLVFVFGLMLAQVALAKGPADKVSVSGPGLVQEISTTSADLVLDLSMGYFEAACHEPVGDTTSLPEGYTISRYYQTGDGSFHLHDSFTYYPRSDQQGVVYSIHFEDMSSGQPEHWVCASERGEQAFRHLLAEVETQPYLMLAQAGGLLHIADPESLVQIAEIDLFADHPSHIRSLAGGQALVYRSVEGHLMLNLETGVQCIQAPSLDAVNADQQVIESADGRWRALVTQSSERTVVGLEYMEMGMTNSRNLPDDFSGAYSGMWDANGTRFYLTDGAAIYRFEPYNEGRMHQNMLSLPDAAAAPLEIAGVVNDTAYLYHPQEAGQAGLPGGIFVVNALTGEQIDHLQPELAFTRILLSDSAIYGVQAQSDTNTQLYSIDRTDGTIRAEGSLQGSISQLDYATMNPNVLGSTITPVSLSNCPDETSPFVSLPDPLALSQ